MGGWGGGGEGGGGGGIRGMKKPRRTAVPDVKQVGVEATFEGK